MPETQKWEVLGTSDGWEMYLNRKIVVGSLDSFSNSAQPESILLYSVELGEFLSGEGELWALVHKM